MPYGVQLFLNFKVLCVLSVVYKCQGEKQVELNTVDVTKLAAFKQGTELLLIENAYKNQKNYKLEDFFWTGSGDGYSSNEEINWGSESPSTIYRTKTVLSTVYIESPSSRINQTTNVNDTKCTINCQPPFHVRGINPTPTNNISSNGNITDEEVLDADRQFWLLTVLKSDGKDPVMIDLKNSLAKLYRTAFQRQQERHLGINGRDKRETSDKPVNVYIHRIAKSPVNGDGKIEVLYHVSVSGKPVDAATAAADMRFVSDDEVMSELGYPFLVKAEPYIKILEPQSLSSPNNTWLFIGSCLAILIVLLLTVAFISLCFNKKKKARMGLENHKKIFIETKVQENKEFHNDSKQVQAKQNLSPTYINFRSEPLNKTLKSESTLIRSESSLSSSTASTSSIDISPLMGLKKQQKSSYSSNLSRPKAALNKTVPFNVTSRHINSVDSDSNCSSQRNSQDIILVESYDNGILSPKSYLSMPSIQSFPRSNIPESLNKVLEPVSVLHLDLTEDTPDDSCNKKTYLTRHGSLGTEDDPGILGPVVWNIHQQRLQELSSNDIFDSRKTTGSVGKMRKRFHDLLDDTFSLFGSRKDLSIDDSKCFPVEIKSHSAINNSVNDNFQTEVKRRPKTSDPRRVTLSPVIYPLKGAWTSKAPSPLVRPLSAGPLQRPSFTPQVDVDQILAEGKLQPNDPAISLIAAIKTEIEKCSLPGSTANLVE